MPAPPRTSPVYYAVLAVIAAVPAAWALVPTFDFDLWWHLRVGQVVSESGRVPHFDEFSRLGRETPTPWLAYSWLFEWWLYQAYSRFGDAGVLWARTLLVALSTAALFAVLLRHGRWRPIDVLACGLAIVPLLYLSSERPWHVTIAFTALTLAVVNDLRDGTPVPKAVWLPLVFSLWANVHIQFVLGWAVLGLAVVFPGRADRRRLIALTAACVLATAATPFHFRLFGVIFEYAAQSAELGMVNELAPPKPTEPPALAAAALLVISAVAVLRARPLDWFKLGMLAFALVFSLRMVRDVWLAGLAAAAALKDDTPAPRYRTAGVVALVFGAFVGVRLLGYRLPEHARDTAAWNAKRYPVAAAEFVRTAKPPGPLFNTFDWGGYLIWALPDYPVSIDGRTNLYGSERVKRSIAYHRDAAGFEADPDLRSARLVIIPRDGPLTRALRERTAEWAVLYEDELAAVFGRRGP